VPARHTARANRQISLAGLGRIALPAVLVAALLIGVAFLATARNTISDVSSPQHPSGRTVLAPAPEPAGAPVSPSDTATAQITSSIAAAAARAEVQPGTDPIGELTALVGGLGAGGASVAALNLTTGATFSYGAAGGMTMGSIAKVDILETLLLAHMDAHTTLSANDVSLATTMIENSDNNAADALWAEIGGAPVFTVDNPRLGIPNLVLGAGGLWGLGTTCAADQVTLLKNLVATGGPLDAASQQFALGLMHNIEADQRWGVGTIADAGTTVANKNGWLAVDNDNDRWLVNSDGIVTVSGQTVLISILTQHNANENDGITLVENIAGVVAPAIAH
jgi:beta-lactamase class A